MKLRRLVLCLTIFPAGFAFLGGVGEVDAGGIVAVGMVGGALVGVFFGLVFGGNPTWRVWGAIFGAKKPEGPNA